MLNVGVFEFFRRKEKVIDNFKMSLHLGQKSIINCRVKNIKAAKAAILAGGNLTAIAKRYGLAETIAAGKLCVEGKNAVRNSQPAAALPPAGPNARRIEIISSF